MYFIQQSIQSLIGKPKVSTTHLHVLLKHSAILPHSHKTLKKKQLPTLFWQRQGFEMAKATEVLALKALEGN